MRGVKRACKVCGADFVAWTGTHTHCEECRQPNGPMRLRQRAMERLWTDWLIRQLEPFLGLTVNMNDLILHLRDQAAKRRDAA